MEYIFRGIVNLFSESNHRFTMGRSPISLEIRQKKYTGEYEIDRGVLYVFFEGRSASSAVTDPSPELLARLLLVELVFQAPSWREPNKKAQQTQQTFL
jgi:hypothetical protein